MITKSPDFTLSRSGNDVTITLPDTEANRVRVYKSDEHNTSFSFLLDDLVANFPQVVDTTTGNAKYKVEFILEGSDEVINTSTEVINTSTVVMYSVIQTTRKSISKFTKA